MSRPDARDTLRALVWIDRCVAVWCAAQCARNVLHHVPAGEERPRLAIEAAERWAREPTEENRKVAHAAATNAATHAADAAYAYANANANANAYAANAYAAAYAATNAAMAATNVVATVTHAAMAATNAVATATNAANAYANANAANAHALIDFDTLVRGVQWPLTVPTLAQVLDEPRPVVAVAWDQLFAVVGEITVEQLIDAHNLCQSNGLDWNNPVHRAICERITKQRSLNMENLLTLAGQTQKE